MESSRRADSKTVPGFDDWPRLKGVIEQNKILDSFCHYCNKNEKVHLEETLYQQVFKTPKIKNTLPERLEDHTKTHGW